MMFDNFSVSSFFPKFSSHNFSVVYTTREDESFRVEELLRVRWKVRCLTLTRLLMARNSKYKWLSRFSRFNCFSTNKVEDFDYVLNTKLEEKKEEDKWESFILVPSCCYCPWNESYKTSTKLEENNTHNALWKMYRISRTLIDLIKWRQWITVFR